MPLSTKDTYDSKTYDLASMIGSRDMDDSYDDVAINFIIEVSEGPDGKEVNLIKRHGVEEIIASVSVDDVRGMYYSTRNDKLYVAINQDVYVYDGSTFALVDTLVGLFASGTVTDRVGFCTFLYSTGTADVIATDGIQLYTIDNSETATASATVAATVGTHLPKPIFYDGYLLLVKSGTVDCYNSDLDTPLVWTAGNYISAEINADSVTDITRINNYFALFGPETIEYFYDVGNPTGTPFARNDVFVKLVGLVGGSVTSYGNQVFLVGKKEGTSSDVYVLEDFKITPIGNPAVRRWLSTIGNGVFSAVLSFNGHDFYFIRGFSSTYGARSYIYDIGEKYWSEIRWKTNSSFALVGSEIIDNTDGKESLVVVEDNAIKRFSPSVYQDDGVNFNTTLITKRFEFGTNKNKFMSSLSIWADRSPSVGSIDVYVTDNDYSTYSTARSLNLSQERPCLKQWGRFRTRAFKFNYASNNPLRIRKLEVDINTGVS